MNSLVLCFLITLAVVCSKSQDDIVVETVSPIKVCPMYMCIEGFHLGPSDGVNCPKCIPDSSDSLESDSLESDWLGSDES